MRHERACRVAVFKFANYTFGSLIRGDIEVVSKRHQDRSDCRGVLQK